MRFRRKKDADDGAGADAGTAPESGAEPAAGDAGDAGDVGDAGTAPAGAAATGPHDADDLPDDGVHRVDLGSLLVPPDPGRELRMQVDERSGTVQSVVLTGKDGAIEVRAFAAPRGGDLWSEVRPQIAADMAQRGGTATEREGRFGTELVCRVQVTRADGTKAVQPSRIVGINGPRWLLRATFLGRPAVETEGVEEWEDALTRLAVRRGAEAMPVGEPLPLTLPEQARRVPRRTDPQPG